MLENDALKMTFTETTELDKYYSENIFTNEIVSKNKCFNNVDNKYN